MRIAEGDIISTVDGRYGKIIDVYAQSYFFVQELADIEDPCNTETEVFVCSIKNVASIR